MKALPLGASSVAAVLGLSPWRTAYDVWLRATGRTGDTEPSPIQLLGQRLESAVMDAHRARTGAYISTDYADRDTLGFRAETPSGHCFLAAHPDGFYRVGCHPVVVEIKTARGAPWEALPEHYRVQVIAQCAAIEADEGEAPSHGEVVCYHYDTGADTVWRVDYDPALGARLLAHIAAWWEAHVLADVPPEITAAPTTALSAALPATPGAAWLDCDDAARALVDAWINARAVCASADADLDAARAKLCAHIGNAPGIAGLIEWKSDKNGRRTLKLL